MKHAWIALWLGAWTGAAVPMQAVPVCVPGEILVRLSGAAPKALSAATPELAVLRDRYEVVADAPLFAGDRLARVAKPAAARALGRWHLLRMNGPQDPRMAATDFQALPEVEEAQPNFLRRFAYAPDDPRLGEQWNLRAMGWAATRPGDAAEVVVAVIDSGLDFDHPDIASQVWTNAAEREGLPGVDDDANGYVDDSIGWDFTDAPGLPGHGDYLDRDNEPRDESGHGTHVAGIIGATVDNGEGIAGVAPGVRVMPLRAGFNLGQGAFLEDDDIAAAMVYAVENGAHILNLSWGSPELSPLIRDVVRYAFQAGCVVVAAAGNEGNDQVFVPARLDETVGVGASNAGGQILSFSNWGPSIDLAAPGHAILSLELGGGYGVRSGTSMAAAHVTGLAALVLARSPFLGPREVQGALVAAALGVGPAGWDALSGAGIAQAAAANIDVAPVLQITAPASGTVVSEAVEVRLALGGSGLTEYDLSWGWGTNPGSWNLLAGGAVESGGQRAVGWDPAGLTPGAYQLRARARWEGRWLEERVAVRVQDRAPRVSNLALSRVLDGPRWEYLVRWNTDAPAGGVVRVFSEGEDAALYELPAAPERTSQRLHLPGELPPGTYRIHVRASGAATGTTLSLEIDPGQRAVSRWDLALLAELPDGYVLPQLGDFDRDGHPELVQMGYGSRFYNPVEFYEYGAARAELVHTSSRLFIPWNIHDLDADGLDEIMAVDAQRVRLIEAGGALGFPERVIWEQRDVWGGEVADLDGDGRLEMHLRSGQGEFFHVFEAEASDRFVEVLLRPNPTDGVNELGERQVVADLDGDGKSEVLSGDADGDLFVYEGVADNEVRTTWREEILTAHVDARVVGGGADLDGDGRLEFVAARLYEDPYAPERNHWVASVYQSTGDNSFAPEWQVVVLGGKSRGNGVSAADLDGDGQVEFVLALSPNLYVVRSTGVDAYEPVWHARSGDAYRPALGDLDGDGGADLTFSAGGRVRSFSLRRHAAGLYPPPDFAAYPGDLTRVVLRWEPVSGAGGYRVYRDGDVRAERVDGTAFEDQVAAGQIHAYAVAALDATLQVEGPATAAIVVQPQNAPRVLTVERLSDRHLGVTFSTAVDVSHRAPYLFSVEPEPGIPSSVVSDRNGRRAVLGFVDALPDSGRFVLQVRELSSLEGTPLAADSEETAFDLRPYRPSTRLLAVRTLSATRLEMTFSRPVVLPAAPEGAFSFDDPLIRVQQVSLLSPDTVVVDLAEDGRLRALGRRYRLRIRGLQDAEGHVVEAQALVAYAPDDLGAVTVFPNPFHPGLGDLTFAGLNPGARVQIYDLAGRVVRQLREQDGDGGVQWDGLNAAGKPVRTGVYLYRATSSAQAREGKFGLVRE